MSQTIQYQDGRLLIPFTKEQFLAVEADKMGYVMGKNILLQAAIPCFVDGETPLMADALILNDDGEPLSMVLCGFPLEDEKTLRMIADIFSNSAKRCYGQRPITVFLTDGKVKVANSLLGNFDTDPKPLPKPALQEFVSVHNIQEKVLFDKLLSEPELLQQFLTDHLDTEKVNDSLMAALETAKEKGFTNYYHELCPDAESRKALPKQAALLAGFGEEEYKKMCHAQVLLIKRVLMPKAAFAMAQGAKNKNWLTIEKDSAERRMQEWAFAFLGWDRQKDIQRNVSVPCYYQPNMSLLADYAFLDPYGKPVLLYIRDELNLSADKMFVTAEFYARSFKAVHGIAPMIVFYSDGVARMKAGSLSGGFEPVKMPLTKKQLLLQCAIVNVTEERAWNELMPHVPELQKFTDVAARTKEQLKLVQASADATTELLKEDSFLAGEFDRVRNDTALPEESFWRDLLGEAAYTESRDNELKLIRTFVADKRISAGVLH